MQRWIIHIDMDAFFAAVEQRDHPEWRGLPVIVGGIGSRGVVATASYEARAFGVHSAMSIVEARRRCPQGVYVASDHRRYAAVSAELRRIFAEFSPLVEPLSLDEAFLDVSGMERLYESPVAIAKAIKEKIAAELHLTASAGIGPNKFLAKLASDWQKPNGLTLIRPEEAAARLAPLPLKRMWGVGEVLAASLHKIGIRTIGDLAAADLKLLERYCGQAALQLKRLAQGLDERPVIPEQAPKSIGNEVTLPEDLYQDADLQAQLLALAEKVGWRLRRSGFSGRTITLKLRFASFKTITRSKTLTDATAFDEVLYQTAWQLCRQVVRNEGIRLIGLTVSHLQPGSGELALFDDGREKRSALYAAVDGLRERFGGAVVTKGRLVGKDEKGPERDWLG